MSYMIGFNENAFGSKGLSIIDTELTDNCNIGGFVAWSSPSNPYSEYGSFAATIAIPANNNIYYYEIYQENDNLHSMVQFGW